MKAKGKTIGTLLSAIFKWKVTTTYSEVQTLSYLPKNGPWLQSSLARNKPNLKTIPNDNQ